MKKANIAILYLVSFTREGENVLKYASDAPDSGQFRQAFIDVVRAFKREGARVYFADVDGLTDEGVVVDAYELVTSDSSEPLKFASVRTDIIPDVVINRQRDSLYYVACYAALCTRGVTVVNTREVAELGNKLICYNQLGAYMPESRNISANDAMDYRLAQIIDMLDKHGKVIVKPLRMNGGKAIEVLTGSDSAKVSGVAVSDMDYLLQEYVETQDGIPGLMEGRHDLRLYVVGGRAVGASMRQPAEGGILSNTSQGGSIKFIELADVSANLMEFAGQVIESLVLPKASFISVDFFYGNDRWYVIEVNDQPGVPALFQNKNVATAVQSALVNVCLETVHD